MKEEVKYKFCRNCNLEHPDMHGLMSKELVTGHEMFKYRNFEFEIWTIHNKESTMRSSRKSEDGHWWAWAQPVSTTAELLNRLYISNFIPDYIVYYYPGFSYREDNLHTKEAAVKHAKETLVGRVDDIHDKLVSEQKEKLRLKLVDLEEVEKIIEGYKE